MVLNIKRPDIPITLHCNAGPRQVEYNANLNGYMRVWYDPKAIAKIIFPF